MKTMNEMKTNDTMKKTKDATDDARECAPLVPAPPMRSGALASTPREHEPGPRHSTCYSKDRHCARHTTR